MIFKVFGDLHGNTPSIKDNFDAIISPGDFSATFSREYKFKAMRDSKRLNKKVNWKSYLNKEEVKKILEKEKFSMYKVLNYLNSFNKPVYFVPGNYEPRPNKLNKIIKDFPNLINCHLKLIKLNELNIIGYGYNTHPEIPQNKKDKMIYSNVLEQDKIEYKKNKKILFSLLRNLTNPPP